MNRLLAKIKEYKAKNDYLNYGRDIIAAWVDEFSRGHNGSGLKVLDIGCGPGDDLLNIKNVLGENGISPDLFGVEIYPEYIVAAKTKGIEVAALDMEKDPLPWPNDFFDIIIINQVLEHTKEIFWILSQANRALKSGGLLIIGVPNLAAWHNRILLLLGRQPSCTKVLSAHVRGFTKKDLLGALTKYGGFSFWRYAGSNLYLLPRPVSIFLSRLFPALATTFFLALKKKAGDNFRDFLERYLETNYRI